MRENGRWRRPAHLADALFDRQYTLTENVVHEVRYRTETRTGTRTVTDPVTGESSTEDYEYTVQVPYDYYICYVTLDNFNLSHLPVYIMGGGQGFPVFPLHGYAGEPARPLSPARPMWAGTPTRPRTMTCQRHIWPTLPLRRCSPRRRNTSAIPMYGAELPGHVLDCSGFVSWVVNHSGWSVGRLKLRGSTTSAPAPAPPPRRPGFLQGNL